MRREAYEGKMASKEQPSSERGGKVEARGKKKGRDARRAW